LFVFSFEAILTPVSIFLYDIDDNSRILLWIWLLIYIDETLIKYKICIIVCM
jgi:hypothetical protein